MQETVSNSLISRWKDGFWLGFLSILLALVACSPMPITPPVETNMDFPMNILDLQFNKAFYRPGETVHITLRIESEPDQPVKARIKTSITHLTDLIGQTEDEITLQSGIQTVHFTFLPPKETPRGYGWDVQIVSLQGKMLASTWAAFDVLDRWTQTPRYGFLSDFVPNRKDIDQTIEILTRYHINGLQFYDWMYRHEQLLTSQEPYVDLMGRTLSRQTVDAMIASAHEHSIAAMPYTAIYGASLAFYRQHPDWAIYNAVKEPYLLGTNFMAYMDPRPSSLWSQHLLDQFDQVLEQTDFDGIHLDQYGDPKKAYDAQGNLFDLDVPIAQMIDETKIHVNAHRPEGAVVFNAVTNWPIYTVAPSSEDFVYIEVWPPYTGFKDLHSLITGAQKIGKGKPVVLAAYVDPAYEQNVRLMEATIFASGGGHIELGERETGVGLGTPGMLAEPYFPKYKTMSDDLAQAVLRDYDFSVRYQEVIGPQTRDATQDFQDRITIDRVSTAHGTIADKVWPIVRQGNGFISLNLVNLLGINQTEWAQPVPKPPTPLTNFQLYISGIQKKVARAWLASPDNEDISPQSLAFTQTEGNLTIDIPSLAYWDMVVIEWK